VNQNLYAIALLMHHPRYDVAASMVFNDIYDHVFETFCRDFEILHLSGSSISH
jgi:hypothetical protein